jgi:hypothetical protein
VPNSGECLGLAAGGLRSAADVSVGADEGMCATADVPHAVADVAPDPPVPPPELASRALARGLDSIACRIASRSDSFEPSIQAA